MSFEADLLKYPQSHWVHLALGVASGAVCMKPGAAEMIGEHFGKNASRRVARAKKKDVQLTHMIYTIDLEISNYLPLLFQFNDADC